LKKRDRRREAFFMDNCKREGHLTLVHLSGRGKEKEEEKG